MAAKRFLHLPLALALAAAVLAPPPALSQSAQGAQPQTQPTATATRDDLASRVAALEKTFEEKREEAGVPGASLVVVRGDQVLLLKGSGVRDAARNLPVTPDTLFAIGSCTKAFTALAAVISQDDGKLSLDDPPRKFLPYFKLRDPEADARVTIRDLLSHRTGLGNTDIAWYTGTLGREEVIRVALGAKPTAKPREKFQYQNVMYSAAGEAVARAQGATWEEVIATRILKPLGMTKTVLSVGEMRRAPDFSLGYRIDSETKQAHEAATRDLTNIAPAGAINSSAREMAEWLKFLVAGGVAPGGRRLVSEKGFTEILTPQIKIDATTGYALGWAAVDFRGQKLYTHAGGIDGFGAIVAFIPREKVALALLANVEGTPLLQTMVRSVVTGLLGPAPAQTAAANRPASNVRPQEEAGQYNFEAAKMIITVSSEGGKLYLVAPGQPRYTLEPVGGRRYRFAEVPGFFATFRPVPGRESETELYLEQPQGNYTLPRLKPSDAPSPNAQTQAAASPTAAPTTAASPATPPQSSTLAEAGGDLPLGELVGAYELQPGVNAEVKVEGGKVVFVIPGQPPYPLVERGKDLLHTPLLPDTYSIRVKRDAAGRVASLLLKQPEGEFELKRVGGAPTPDKPGAEAKPPIGADELLAKMIAAAGGAENLRRHRSMVTTGTVRFETQGLDGETTTYAQAPNSYAREVTFIGLGKRIGTTREFFDGSRGGEEASFIAQPAAWGERRLAEKRATSDFYELLNRKSLYKTVAVTGTAKESGEDAYVVVLTPERGHPITEYVSTKTFLVLRRDTVETLAGGGEAAPVTARFSDYRAVDGVLVPFRIAYDVPATGEAAVVVREVKFDVPIPPEAFRPRAK